MHYDSLSAFPVRRECEIQTVIKCTHSVSQKPESNDLYLFHLQFSDFLLSCQLVINIHFSPYRKLFFLKNRRTVTKMTSLSLV